MLKKLISAAILAAALTIGGAAAPMAPAASTAEASDYYIGTYSDGTNAFLVTESVCIYSYHPYTFSCVVKYADTRLYYRFFPYNGSPYYRNSEGYEGYVYGGASPVAANIYGFVVRNY